MESHVRIGDEWIPAPVFTIGDAVLNVYDDERDDIHDPRPRIFEWSRGIVVGMVYTRDVDELEMFETPGWVYQVRIVACYDCRGTTRWNHTIEPFHESELKRSHYTPRYFNGTTTRPSPHHQPAILQHLHQPALAQCS